MSTTTVQEICFICQHGLLGGTGNGREITVDDYSEGSKGSGGDSNYGANKTGPTTGKFLSFAENHLEISTKDLNLILEEGYGYTSRLFCQECDNLISVVDQLYEEMYGIVRKLVERLEVLVNFLESHSSSDAEKGDYKTTTRSADRVRVLQERRRRGHKYDDLRRMISQKCKFKGELLSRTLPSCLVDDSSDNFNGCTNKEDEINVKIEVDPQSGDDDSHVEDNEDYVQSSMLPSSDEKSAEECSEDVHESDDSGSEWNENSVDEDKEASNKFADEKKSSQEEDSGSESKTMERKRRKLSSARDSKMHTCDKCQKSFNSQPTLCQHQLDIHRIEKSNKKINQRFECDICRKGFVRKAYIDLHKEKVHKIPRPQREKLFKCEICNQKYKSRVSLQTHSSRIHGVRISFRNNDKKRSDVKVEIVEDTDKTKSTSVAVMNPTTKIRSRFSCGICGKSFTTKYYMELHKNKNHKIGRPHRKEKQYSCDICEKKFIYISTLKRHKANLHNEIKYSGNEDKQQDKQHKCTMCPNSYKDRYILERHLNTKHIKQCAPKTVSFSCSECSMQFSSRRLLSYHVTETHKTSKKTLSFLRRMESAKSSIAAEEADETNEICVVCQLSFKSWDLLRKHLEHHEVTLPEEEKCKKCYFCCKSFAHEQTVWAHIRSCVTHDYTKIEFPCDHENHYGLPQWSYKTPTLLENHFKEHHGQCKIVRCTECDWPFLGKSMLDLHRLCHLTRVKSKYQCPTCYKFFLNSESLRNHYNVAHGESLKLYRCQVCSWGFPSKNGFAVHMNSHKDSSVVGGGDLQQNKFQCTECPKSYQTAAQLRDHRRGSHIMRQCQECGLVMPKSRLGRHFAMNHQGAGIHLCTICGKVYRTAGSLKKHMTSHGVCLQYDCQFCGKKYSVGSLLKRHVARHHNGSNAEAVENTNVEGVQKTAS